MAIVNFESCITSLLGTLVEAICRLVCGPFYEHIKTSFQALAKPESLYDDSKTLTELLNQIKQMDALDEINNWIKEAEVILRKVSSSNRNDDQLSCGSYFDDACSRCLLHKDIKKMIVRGNGIINRDGLLPKPVEHIHGVPEIKDGTTADRNLKQIMDMLKDNEVWIIGVWGPVGVGKTTLANALINKLLTSSPFTLVRFVPLTKDVEEIQVQKAIAEELGVEVKGDMNTRKTTNQIYNRLQREKFLLILDNVSKSIDLKRIGIPENQNGSKIMLTTRLKNVCMAMKVKSIEIGCLDDTEDWKLFAEKAGGVVTHPEIQPLAKEVCKECGGLPLALVAGGSAMSGKDNVRQWQSTLDDLRSSNVPNDMEPQVYKPLKLSYDSLANETLKSCFLYCSLYPEGFKIPISELVQCWLAENIIDEQLTYESACIKGLDLIENLKKSYLLEGWDDNHVKMHDVIRDFATRIAKSDGTSTVFSGYGISKSLKVTSQQGVENIRWISFVDNDELVLPEYKKGFREATTLLLDYSKDGLQLPEEFLKGFQALRVLNARNLQSFPHSSLHLLDLRALLLRNCIGDMEELPCGTKLMVLDLSKCSFHKLPRGIEKQTSLRVLVLSHNRSLKTIEVDVILNLSALEVLDMTLSGYEWPTVRKSEDSKEMVLEDLSRLEKLKEAYLDLADVEATYEGSSWLEKLTRFAFYYNYWDMHVHKEKIILIGTTEGNKIGSFIGHAKEVQLHSIYDANEIFANVHPNSWSNCKLKKLKIINCYLSKKLTEPIPNFDTLPNLERLSFFSDEQSKSFYQIANALGTTFPKLRKLQIAFGEELENVLLLDYPHVVMPELEKIRIQSCDKMTEVFHDDSSEIQAAVPKLKKLYRSYLESLQCLCSSGSSEHWQFLEVLYVRGCPNLKKLPRMASIKDIEGEEEWWNNLEWDSPETKSHMTQFFRKII